MHQERRLTMSNWIFIIIGAIVGVYGAYKDWSFKKIGIILVGVILAGSVINSFSSSYDEEGYNFALRNLKAPSSATLLEYIPKGEFTDRVKENTTFKIPKDLKFEYYKIEATNGFGGRLAKDFVVFFWKGKPVYMEEDGVECFSSPENWRATKLAIKYNAGIDIDQ